ncbi:MAG: M20/M25/M40 family metallo-hydrolase [Acidobacteriota bacterium]
MLRLDVERLEESWQGQRDDRLELLRRLVDTNSHFDNLPGIDAERAILRPVFEELGFVVEELLITPADSPRPRAAHLVARRAGRPGARKAMLIAHLDTVFPADEGPSTLRVDGDLLHGPGVGDIKGGVVTILTAAALLADQGRLDDLELLVALNSDEEVGSHSSRGLLRELAAPCDLALGFEPAFHRPEESVERHSIIQHVIRRKGCGREFFHLRGVAAHSGGAHDKGASAIEALARKVVDVHALTDYDSGVTTNVGLVSGGRSVNTVAPVAAGEIDFRFATAETGEATARAIKDILQREENVNAELGRAVTCELEPGGGVLWPTLEPTSESEVLSRTVCEATADLGWEAEPIARGGASDAANAAAVGTPAICGLGPVTHGIHTSTEHSSIPALRAASLIAAEVLARLSEPPAQG